MEPKMLRCMLDRDERQWPSHHLLLHYSLVWFSTQSAIITYHHHLWLITVCLGTEWVHVCFSVKNSQKMPWWSTAGIYSRVQHVVFLQTCFLFLKSSGDMFTINWLWMCQGILDICVSVELLLCLIIHAIHFCSTCCWVHVQSGNELIFSSKFTVLFLWEGLTGNNKPHWALVHQNWSPTLTIN